MQNTNGDPERYGLGVVLAAFLLGAVVTAAGFWLAIRVAAPPPPVIFRAAALSPPVQLETGKLAGSLALTVPGLPADTHRLPLDYTCYRADFSPALAWRGAPAGTKSFAVIMARPAAHAERVNWAVFNIPADAITLPSGPPRNRPVLPGGLAQALNDQGTYAYAGPCEPYGAVSYVLRLYALDSKIALKEGIDKNALFAAMNGHILDMAEVPVVHDRQYGSRPPPKSSPSAPAKSETDRPPARNPQP